MRYIVFTDLDGTLLDHDTYAFIDALPGVAALKRAGIPIVFCSSKTRAEQLALRRELEIKDPFVVENGGAVFVEPGYFPVAPKYTKITDRRLVVELGLAYRRIREGLIRVRSELDMYVQGYADLSVEQVAAVTGLPIEAASLARQREYSETLVTPLDEKEARRLKKALAVQGLTLTRGGRFHSVDGHNDKGKAVDTVTDMFRQDREEITTVGIGDSWNDAPLLAAVQIPVLVQRPGAVWEDINLKGIQRIDGIGPAGWSNAIEKLLAGELPLSER